MFAQDQMRYVTIPALAVMGSVMPWTSPRFLNALVAFVSRVTTSRTVRFMGGVAQDRVFRVFRLFPSHPQGRELVLWEGIQKEFRTFNLMFVTGGLQSQNPFLKSIERAGPSGHSNGVPSSSKLYHAARRSSLTPFARCAVVCCFAKVQS